MPYPLRILCLGVTFLLAACAGLEPEKQPPTASASAAPEEPATVATERESPPAPLIAKRTVEDDVRQLLQDAEAAMAADRLTTPAHDNAFDRYQAVLLLRPENQQAKTGLQQVFARYVALIRDALARNQPGAARALVERAKLVDRDHPMLAELNAEIDALRTRLASQPDSAGGAGADKEILLDARTLDRRDPEVVEKLKRLATQVKEREETLLIVARSDAEGRWIYQRMSEGVPDYRLRGDIRLGREPKILLLPPIE